MYRRGGLEHDPGIFDYDFLLLVYVYIYIYKYYSAAFAADGTSRRSRGAR